MDDVKFDGPIAPRELELGELYLHCLGMTQKGVPGCVFFWMSRLLTEEEHRKMFYDYRERNCEAFQVKVVYVDDDIIQFENPHIPGANHTYEFTSTGMVLRHKTGKGN